MSDLRFPSVLDGPPRRVWLPVVPTNGGNGYGCRQDVFKFSVRDASGVTQRFLMTRERMAWLVATMVEALSPRLGRFAWWWFSYQARISSQSDRSSGRPSVDGSPQDGHAE
jgi:hypothetical protein